MSKPRLVTLAVPACLLATVAGAAVPGVPRSLGQGTGGDGTWSATHAEHSPSTVTVKPHSGPEQTPGAILEFAFAKGKYNWNWANVSVGSVDPTATQYVRLTYCTDVPPGVAKVNLMIREADKASYWIPGGLPLSPKRFSTVTVSLDRFRLAPWAKDSNASLDPDRIVEVSIGLETGSSGQGQLIIGDAQLVPAGW